MWITFGFAKIRCLKGKIRKKYKLSTYLDNYFHNVLINIEEKSKKNLVEMLRIA